MADIRHLNLFPFCIWPSKQAFIDELYAPPIPTVYQDFDNTTETIVADLGTIMALYWRVKKWKVSGVFEYYITSKVSTNYEFILTRDAATEADLVCTDELGYVKQFTRTGTPITDSWSGGTLNFTAAILLPFMGSDGPPTNRAAIKQGDNLYSAGISFFAGFEEGEPSADEYISPYLIRSAFKTSSPSFPEAEPPNAVVPINFLNQTYGLLAQSSKIELTIEIGGNLVTIPLDINMAIDAIEYWEYDPNDGGGPIYNSATGAQLRPFP